MMKMAFHHHAVVSTNPSRHTNGHTLGYSNYKVHSHSNHSCAFCMPHTAPSPPSTGLGGGGIFMTGFSNPTTFGPWLESHMAMGPWSVAVVMIGINDLLRGGRAADEIMSGLRPMLAKVLTANTAIILIPPFAAPGFVQE